MHSEMGGCGSRGEAPGESDSKTRGKLTPRARKSAVIWDVICVIR